MFHPALIVSVVLLWAGLALRYYPALFRLAMANTFANVDEIRNDFLFAYTRREFVKPENVKTRNELIKTFQSTGLWLIVSSLVVHILVISFGFVEFPKQYTKYLLAHIAPVLIAAPILVIQFEKSNTTKKLLLRDSRSWLQPIRIVIGISIAILYAIFILALVLAYISW